MPAPNQTDHTWQALAASKRAGQVSLIPDDLRLAPPAPGTRDVRAVPAASGLLSARELAITGCATVTGLLASIHDGTYSAVEVVSAFGRRALIAHQLTNCLTEIFIDRAVERAKELDAYFAQHGHPVGPLHGLPVSLKEQVAVAGVELSFGYVGYLGTVSDKDAVLTEILVEQGAVPYVRTNIAQGLWFGESLTNVFGQTTNPFNRDLTCGGSSGGEGALLALGGSILGVGSDIGGSIRIPAAFQALYALRPSYHRVPYCGTVNSSDGQCAVPSVLGPLATSVDALGVFMRAVAAAKPWTRDPQCPRMPWDEAAYHLAEHGGEGGKLCFAIMWDDGVVVPASPYRRALEETRAALLKAGHEVIDWEPLESAAGEQLLADIFDADGGADHARALALSGEPDLSHGVTLAGPDAHRALDHWAATAARTHTGRPVDAVLVPAHASPPPPHRTPVYIYYTSWCNLNNYPAGVVPVTCVDPALDAKEPRDVFHGPRDEYNYKLYDPEYMKGAPIGLQVVGRQYEEEAVIRMTEIVDEAIKKARA